MKNFLLLALLILAALVGCKKQPEMDSNLLNITAVKSDFDTKATETSFEVGDKIGLFINENVGNLPYETLDGTSWKCRGFLNEFLESKEYFATAYYPFSESAKDMSAIEVGNGIDFMISAKTKLDISGNAASGTLQFKHVLSKLVANIDMPEEIDGVKTVSLDSVIVKNVFRKGVINLATGVISGLTDKGDISSATNEIIVIPQTAPKIEFVFKMAGGGFSKLTYNTPLLLESGKKTTLNAQSNADLYFASVLDLKSGEAQTNLPLSIYVATGRKWTLKSSETWLTFSKTSGTGKGLETITANVAQNAGVPRTATLTLADDKPSKTTTKAMQNYVRTVTIAGTKWTTRNLTGPAGQAGTSANISICPNPQDYGNFFKWGDKWIYGRVSSTADGDWSSVSSGASIIPSASQTGGMGYDYQYNLSGGRASGDPCALLGNYRTPTHAQWQNLKAAGYKWGAYKNINGYFLGANYAACSATSIASGCIFLPTAGYRYWIAGAYIMDGFGLYWSSSVSYSDGGWNCPFSKDYFNTDDNTDGRGDGSSVRCVAE